MNGYTPCPSIKSSMAIAPKYIALPPLAWVPRRVLRKAEARIRSARESREPRVDGPSLFPSELDEGPSRDGGKRSTK